MQEQKPSMKNNAFVSVTVTVTGLVQGVGFRPYIYRLAISEGLVGEVRNSSSGVTIFLEGKSLHIDSFLDRLKKEAPVIAKIDGVKVKSCIKKDYISFSINSSDSKSSTFTEVSPDIAVCKDCLNDMKHQHVRLDYPLTNCTNCGPRFSIIEKMPYDRPGTSMQKFEMCSECKIEYNNPADRRFHAQPVACNNCGPKYSMLYKGEIQNDLKDILAITKIIIDEGGVIAIKGVGGFHLVSDPFSESSIDLVREIKGRETKPFAVMFRNIESIRENYSISKSETELLTGWRRPIVIIEGKGPFSEKISSGLNTTGVILPYMPFHYLLFNYIERNELLFTSCNFSEEPLLIDEDTVQKQFGDKVSAVISYNRHIVNRVDDSVMQMVNDLPLIIRRSRSFAPISHNTGLDIDGIFSTGGGLKHSFCIGKDSRAIMSQYIGDIEVLDTFRFYEETYNRFCELFHFNPVVVACDKHPGYQSTRFAEETGLPIIRVQHHYAHIASCMAEHRINEKVLGIAWDGTGYGDDGKIWGSEFFVCDLNGYERISHFNYLPMPGGDIAVKEPWRMALSALLTSGVDDSLIKKLPFFRNLSGDVYSIVEEQIKNRTNLVDSCGAGRLFDSIASLLLLCTKASFEAEPAMRLEDIATNIENCSSYDLKFEQEIKIYSLVNQIVEDVLHNIPDYEISAKFHKTLAELILNAAESIRTEQGIRTIVLSGGVFQNRKLLSYTKFLLEEQNFKVYSPEGFPPNDNGIALGQIAVASQKRKILCV